MDNKIAIVFSEGGQADSVSKHLYDVEVQENQLILPEEPDMDAVLAAIQLEGIEKGSYYANLVDKEE